MPGFALLIAAVFVFSTAIAAPDASPAFQTKSGAELSDQMAFWRVAHRMSLRIEKYGREFAVETLQRDLLLKSPEEAALILDTLVGSDTSIRRRRAENEQDFLCSELGHLDGTSIANRLEAIAALNDISMQEEMVRASIGLGERLWIPLQDYVRNSKSTIVVVTQDDRFQDGQLDDAMNRARNKCETKGN